MAAEWEPALGTIIAWPLGIPHKLVVELAKDGKLFTMVPDKSAKKEAEKWFTDWGIDLNNVQFIFADQSVDAWWLRDWGPHAVFTDGQMKLADGQYPNSTPFSKIACDAELGFIFTEKDEEPETRTSSRITKTCSSTLATTMSASSAAMGFQRRTRPPRSRRSTPAPACS